MPTADTARTAARRVPKHALLADTLAGDIRRGRYQVGDLLPSEPELSASFGVSRHTVRVALQSLHALGLVASRQGVGTEVRRERVGSRYQYAFNSASDLMQYATGTRVRVLAKGEEAVAPALAAYLGCRPGERWWRVRTERADADSGAVIASSDVFVPAAFAGALAHLGRSRKPIYSLVSEAFNEPILEIRQDIAAVAVTAQEGRSLGLAEGAPGLEITRRYVGRGQKILEVARSVHPAGSFRYSMHVRLDQDG